MKYIDLFRKAIFAGLVIGVGAVVKLSVADPVVGAALFSIGLFFICAYGANLFTGKIGYIFHNKNYLDCLLIWVGNLAGTVIAMVAARIAKPALHDAAVTLMENKLSQSVAATAILAVFCGALMYLAVDNFRENSSYFGKVFGVVMCVMVFLLSGYEHSIANMCYAVLYISASAQVGRCLVYLLLVSVCNGAGSVLIRLLTVKKENG